MKDYKLTKREKNYYNKLVQYCKCDDGDLKDDMEHEIMNLRINISDMIHRTIVYYIMNTAGYIGTDPKSFFDILNELNDVSTLIEV